MNLQSNKLTATNEHDEGNAIEYKVDKMTFIVTPVYSKKTKKTIHDLVLNLIKKDCEIAKKP